jgi:hypothetical protein
MRHLWRPLLLTAASGAVAALVPHLALATDCLEITDCLANSVRGSIAALAGVALLVGLFVAPEIFGPILIAKGLAEAITGQDLLTGEHLDWTQRALGVLPVLGEYGQEARTAGQVLREGEQLTQEQAALRDLAAFRAREGMPVAGSAEDVHTAARLDVPGSDPLYGRNAHDLEITMRVNAQTRTHAEAQAFQQALNDGLKADRATMYVDRPLCDACGRYGGIGSMLRATGIKAVEIVAPDGRFLITADRPSIPVRIGDAP